LDRPGSLRIIVTLTVGILAVSCGAILVRLASAPILTVAAYRLFWATLLFAPALAMGPAREISAITLKGWGQLCLSGSALALHFTLWIASLSYTSVASSVLLVDTAPFFIGLASYWLLDRPCGRQFWIGLGVAFAGCLVIFRGDWSQSQASLKGNIMALCGAVAFAVYLLVGARARRKLSLVAYVWPVYGSAAAVLAVICLAAGAQLRGFSFRTYMFLFLLGLVPQCIGHTTYNWALRWLSPALVALVGLAEPVGASLLAYVILNESLTFPKLVGGGIVLLGIYLATLSTGRGSASDGSRRDPSPAQGREFA
jgi:drug/metabolite transporter (DMT)-like permease